MATTHIIHADLNEIIHEERFQGYGAYVLRKKSDRNLLNAALVVAILFIGFTLSYLMTQWLKEIPAEQVVVVNEVPIDKALVPVVIDEPLDKPIPEAKSAPQTAPPIESVRFVVDASSDDKSTATILEVDSLDGKNPDLVDAKADPNAKDGDYDWNKIKDGPPGKGGGGTGTTEIKDERTDHKVFVPTDNEPRAINLDDLKKVIVYPKPLKEAKITGRVEMRIEIDKNGKYVQHIVMNPKRVHPMLVTEVEKHINKIICTPAIQGGKPIYFWITLPFEFSLGY